MLYFIRCGAFVRVEREASPERVFELRAASPYEVELLGTFPASDAEESLLRTTFATFHHRDDGSTFADGSIRGAPLSGLNHSPCGIVHRVHETGALRPATRRLQEGEGGVAAGTWWPSHGADAFRYLCMAYREVAHSEKRPTPIFPALADRIVDKLPPEITLNWDEDYVTVPTSLLIEVPNPLA